MTFLSSRVGHINFAQELSKVKVLVDECRPRITFWGGRVVEVQGTKGYVSLDYLAAKVTRAAWVRCLADNLTIQERYQGIQITKKLKPMYHLLDKELEKVHFITWLFYIIRNSLFDAFDLSSRSYVESALSRYFRGISEKKFIAQYDPALIVLAEHLRPHHADPEFSDGFFSPPFRYTLREDKIIELARNQV